VGRLDGSERQGSWRVLVDTLEHVQVLRDPSGRRLCLDLVEEYLGFALHVAEAQATRVHLFAILLACRQHPRALGVLAGVLEELEPGTPAVRRVRQFVEDMSALELISEKQRAELLELMAGTADEYLTDLVRAAAGPAGVELPVDHHKPEDALVLLEQLNARPDGVPPLLVFVEYLARVVGDHRGDQLRDWNDRQAIRMDIVPQIRAIRAERTDNGATERNRELIAYLVIRLEPDPLGTDVYSLAHWRQVDRGRWHPRRGEVFHGDIDEIRRHVTELIVDAETGWAKEASAIRVDFLLPYALLNLPVDQWDFDVDSGLPRSLGLHYQVVVRSLDRARTPKWHREWRRRWKVLRELNPDIGELGEECWLWSEATKIQHLMGLEATLALRKQVLSLVLRSQPAATEIGEVLVGLRTGIPVMIWQRADTHRSAFEAEVTGMRDELAGLPEGVRRLRGRAKQSTRPHAHVGSRVSLIWDDPERPVEPFDLAAAPVKEVPAS